MGWFSLCCGEASKTTEDTTPLWAPLPGEQRSGGGRRRGGGTAPGLAFGQGALRYDPFASAHAAHHKKAAGGAG